MIKYEIDSRNILPGQIFVAIKGHTVDGNDYINKAIENGATSIITNKEVDTTVPVTVVDDTEKFLVNHLSEEYSSEFSDIKIIGITGTNGKTTTAYILYQLLSSMNINSTYIGTLGFYHKDKTINLENTTPNILELYKLLLEAKKLGSKYVVIEISSHALALNRIKGIKLVAGAFTNLTQDHLDYHETMENYLKEKLKIIDHLNIDAPFVINSDDKYSEYFKSKYPSSISIGSNGDYKIKSHSINPAQINLSFSHNDTIYNSVINLTNEFNIYNYLTAFAILSELGFDINTLLEKTKEVNPPKGRCETIIVNNGYAVVDFAHTPDAVEKVIKAYTKYKENKIITIIGCGGDRDPKKRPIMGNLAASLSDYVIFTNDNPRTEDEHNIMNDIIKGVTSDNYEIIHDRKKAIIKGIEIMKAKDILLILGKGHEDYQIIGHTKYHFDDATTVYDWIKEKRSC